MEKLVVILPWPDKRLSPNARVHHLTLWRVKKKAKGDAKLITLAAILKGTIPVDAWWHRHARLRVSILAVPKIMRERDEDNLQASLKAALDGIAEALGVNDSRFRIEGTEIFPCKQAQPHIEITIQPEVKP